MIQLLAFVLLSIPITSFSWQWLRDPSAHGYYRYFAFESILAQILLNAPFWFRDPLGPLQVLSWIALTMSFALAVHGFYLLRAVGRPGANIEDTTRLVRAGAYRLIRHPLYSSLLWLCWGALLKDISPVSVTLGIIASAFLLLTAKTEEAENVEKFGAEYMQYMSETKRFIPFLF